MEKTKTPPLPHRRFRLALETGYEMDLYSDQITVAHGLRLSILVNILRRWSLVAGFRMEAPLDVTSEKVALSLRRIPLTLGGRFTWRRGRFALGAQLALSLAVITARTTARDLEDSETLPHVPTHAAVALAPAVVLGVRVVRRLELVLSLGVRIYLNNADYRLTTEPSPLVAPWRVQPTVWVGIHVPLL